jgi:hypothetical protein
MLTSTLSMRRPPAQARPRSSTADVSSRWRIRQRKSGHAVAAAFAVDLHDGELVETVGVRPVLVRGHVGLGIHVQGEALAVRGRIAGL